MAWRLGRLRALAPSFTSRIPWRGRPSPVQKALNGEEPLLKDNGVGPLPGQPVIQLADKPPVDPSAKKPQGGNVRDGNWLEPAHTSEAPS